jgi:predicted Co/Zn/Cd cation transporter (cation efflux family)
MADRGVSREQTVLRVSLVASLVLAAVAVGWGLTAGAQIILLDGVYLLLGSAMSGLSLAASRRAAAGPTQRYPFGRESLVPLAIGIQGLALLATCLYASLDAVRTIVDGGTDVAAASVAAYAVLTALAALLLYRYVRRHADG